MLYQDSLITITANEIVFKHYYFPFGREKRVALADIVRVTVKPPTLLNGKWRLHGTGNFKTWFPRDTRRYQRDRIFFAELKDRWVHIGFTAEDGALVEKLLRARMLIGET
mgnify:CR=1 FL=1